MNLIVFGATGPTGLQLVKQALDAGHRVVAVTRDPNRHLWSDDAVQVIGADVGNLAKVEQAVTGADVVISTFGVPFGRQAVSVYSIGIANIIRAMQAQDIARLVCVSSTAIAPDEAPDETLFWRKAVMPFFRSVLGRTVYDDMARMEAIVRASDLNWTILRPAALFHTDAPTGDCEICPPHRAGRYTSRADLAQTLLREATSKRQSREVLEVLTRSNHPSPLTIIKGLFSAGN